MTYEIGDHIKFEYAKGKFEHGGIKKIDTKYGVQYGVDVEGYSPLLITMRRRNIKGMYTPPLEVDEGLFDI